MEGTDISFSDAANPRERSRTRGPTSTPRRSCLQTSITRMRREASRSGVSSLAEPSGIRSFQTSSGVKPHSLGLRRFQTRWATTRLPPKA